MIPYTRGTPRHLLAEYASQCDFVFHLAGVNRPADEKEYMPENLGCTEELLRALQAANSKAPIVFTSSTQAALNNAYGLSKQACEAAIERHGRENGVRTCIYRLPNVFGRGCRPYYNSVVATFCHCIANGLEIRLEEPEKPLRLVYVDRVAEEFVAALKGRERRGNDGFCHVEPIEETTPAQRVQRRRVLQEGIDTLRIPPLNTEFDRQLFATLFSCLPKERLCYPLDRKRDRRGWLAELFQSDYAGQIFVSRTKPGVTRGEHWHRTKIEKFLVLSGRALVTLRKIGSGERQEFRLDGEEPRVVNIPAGHTHAITNLAQEDLITLFWASEVFCPERPDTMREPV